MAFGSRDEDYWVKDDADVNRLVEDVMLQTDYHDPVLVRDTLLDFNFDMASTVDYILSTSVFVSQQNFETPADELNTTEATSTEDLKVNKATADSGPHQVFSGKKHVSDMDEQCEDVGESEESPSRKSSLCSPSFENNNYIYI